MNHAYQRTLDPAFALQMAGRIITAKLYNQRRVLQRLAASRGELRNAECGLRHDARAAAGEASPAHSALRTPQAAIDRPACSASPTAPSPEDPLKHERQPVATPEANSAIRNPQSAIDWLDGLFVHVTQAGSIDELRGYEGASTARYFQALASFLPAEFPFERRSTRPPLNAVNACVSFGSTLLYNECVAYIHAHGLDPALGLLHATEDGRWSLALDLLEPFRPVFVEALALDLFSHQILNAGHFEPKNGGVYLNEEGRKKFFLQYERRLERQFLSESVGHRTTLRQQLEQQAVMFKAALQEPEKFEPFLIN